ncbi:Protein DETOXIFICATION 8, partial [Mucuna pruriens]
MFECFMDKLLIFLGQDDAISIVAGKYCVWFILVLFGYVVLQALVHYFQTQSSIFSMLQCFKKQQRVLLLGLPISIYDLLCFHLYATAFLYFNISKWWSFEMLVILGGILPNLKLEISVILNICNLHYFITYGIGAAISTRVSNELGA